MKKLAMLFFGLVCLAAPAWASWSNVTSSSCANPVINSDPSCTVSLNVSAGQAIFVAIGGRSPFYPAQETMQSVCDDAGLTCAGGDVFNLNVATSYNSPDWVAIGFVCNSVGGVTQIKATRTPVDSMRWFTYAAALDYASCSEDSQGNVADTVDSLTLLGVPNLTLSANQTGTPMLMNGTDDAVLQCLTGAAGQSSISSPYAYNQVFDHEQCGIAINVTASTPGLQPTFTAVNGATTGAVAALALVDAGAPAAAPSCTPGTGTYSTSQSVSCSDATSGTFMCYTTDGTIPSTDGVSTCTNGILYSGALTFNLSTNLKIVAGGNGYTDSPVSSYTYTLTSPYAAPSPTYLTFGTYTVGSSSPIQNVIVTNIGANGLLFSNVATTGDYTESDNCPHVSPLLSGQSCTAAVTFTPSTTGTRTGTLVFTDNSTGNTGTTQTIPLTGTGGTAPNPGITFKGGTIKGGYWAAIAAPPIPVGPPLTYNARTDAGVFGTGVTGELLPAACNGNRSCLQYAWNANAARGHQGATLGYTGNQGGAGGGNTCTQGSIACTPPTPGSGSPSGLNINGLNSYLNGINTVMTDPDFGTTILRATDYSLSNATNYPCLGGGTFGVGWSLGAGTLHLAWASDMSKLQVKSTGGASSILAFYPTGNGGAGQVAASDLCGGYFPGAATFSGTDPHIIFTVNNDQENTVAISGSSGHFITPETVKNGTKSATLAAVNSGFVMLNQVSSSGSYSGNVWTGQTSGATFTAVSNPSGFGNSGTPFANTIYKGIICDGTSISEENAVCLNNPVGGTCAANDTNPACWYVYWSLIFDFNYVPSPPDSTHFPQGANNCLPGPSVSFPLGYSASYTGTFAPSTDSTTFTELFGDNGQANHTGYNGGGNASSQSNYQCPNSPPDGVCLGPVFLANYRVGYGCRVLNTMTDQISGDWGTPGAAQDQMSNIIAGTLTSGANALTPGDALVQQTTGAETQIICLQNSSGVCATSSQTKAWVGVIYGTADGTHTWEDCGNNYPTTTCSASKTITSPSAPVPATYYYPDLVHDNGQGPNVLATRYSLVQTNDMQVGDNGTTYAVSHNGSTNLTTILFVNNTTYSPGQQFIFNNLLGADDQYLNCTGPDSCPVWTAVVVPNTGSNCPTAPGGPYCPSGVDGTITISDSLGGASYNDHETQTGCGKTCPKMAGNPQEQALTAGGFGGLSFWLTQGVYVGTDLSATGHNATGDHYLFQGKNYTTINTLQPWTPATVPYTGSGAPQVCSNYGSPCGSPYGSVTQGWQTPTPANTNVNLLTNNITVADDQHGSMGSHGTQDQTPPAFFTANVCGQGAAVGTFACPYAWGSVFDTEIIAIENWATRSSAGNLVGADCVYDSSATPTPCVYRLGHTFCSGSNWLFDAQNCIGIMSPDGIWIAIPSDWNMTLGCMDGSTACLSSWQATAANASGTAVTWTSDGASPPNVTVNMPNSFCPTNGTQYWYVNGTGIESISCGPTAGTVTLSGFSESWLNQTLTLGPNTANNWNCDSTDTNAGACQAFVLAAVTGAPANGSGSETGTQKAVPPNCASGVPCQRSDVFIYKITTAHQ